MATVDVILPGYPLRTARGSLGYSSCTLVTTDAGQRVLVDCATYADRTQFFEALEQRGLPPERIDVLVLTHLHFDHCINARFFTHARVLLSQAEYDYASRAVRQTPHEDPYVVDDPHGLLGGLRTELLAGDTPLAPDLELLLTPGHTPGSMSVVAHTREGRVAMASDAAKSVSELLTRQIFPSARVDHAQATRSIERLLAAADIIIPGHDRPVRVVDGHPRPEDVSSRPALTFYLY